MKDAESSPESQKICCVFVRSYAFLILDFTDFCVCERLLRFTGFCDYKFLCPFLRFYAVISLNCGPSERRF